MLKIFKHEKKPYVDGYRKRKIITLISIIASVCIFSVVIFCRSKVIEVNSVNNITITEFEINAETEYAYITYNIPINENVETHFSGSIIIGTKSLSIDKEITSFYNQGICLCNFTELAQNFGTGFDVQIIGILTNTHKNYVFSSEIPIDVVFSYKFGVSFTTRYQSVNYDHWKTVTTMTISTPFLIYEGDINASYSISYFISSAEISMFDEYFTILIGFTEGYYIAKNVSFLKSFSTTTLSSTELIHDLINEPLFSTDPIDVIDLAGQLTDKRISPEPEYVNNPSWEEPNFYFTNIFIKIKNIITSVPDTYTTIYL